MTQNGKDITGQEELGTLSRDTFMSREKDPPEKNILEENFRNTDYRIFSSLSSKKTNMNEVL